MEENEESQTPSRKSENIRRTPLPFSKTVMVAVEDLVTYKKAMGGSEKIKWKLAVKEGWDSLQEEQHLDPAVFSPREEAMPGTVVSKRRLDDQASIARQKARLLGKDYVQKDDIDYNQTFAPDILFDALIVRKVTSVGWHVQHADSFNDFLNGDIDIELCSGKTNATNYRRACTG